MMHCGAYCEGSARQWKIFGCSSRRDGFDVFGVASAADAKYVTVTFGTADDPAIEPITKFANVLTKNGALGGRYGPITIGDYANGKTYPFRCNLPIYERY